MNSSEQQGRGYDGGGLGCDAIGGRSGAIGGRSGDRGLKKIHGDKIIIFNVDGRVVIPFKGSSMVSAYEKHLDERVDIFEDRIGKHGHTSCHMCNGTFNDVRFCHLDINDTLVDSAHYLLHLNKILIFGSKSADANFHKNP
ncbi:unnamed protein product [Lupinus luteus]|uniref:Uncharacterized protein n=1 Tax=Lupinus luteus TaxID=3873 RepID=A0AAV1WFG9_LUPLU